MQGFVKKKVEDVINLDKFYMKAYSISYKIIKIDKNEYEVHSLRTGDHITNWRKVDALSSGYEFGVMKNTNIDNY